MPFERTPTSCRGIPGAIYNPDDIPKVGEKIVILSLLDTVDDGAYEIIEKGIARSQKHYLRVHALAYTPGRAAHVDRTSGTALFSYQTLGIVPVAYSVMNPFYATLSLETYQQLCSQGVHEPKGQGGRDAVQLRP